ncbi:RDD family protein [Streptomyces sp. NBC_01500]|uniref:RDD family protein n=1 Tax=Streptomyces sp. NBC_01500 TaxID=2903886 RepID=UPI002254C4D6|nr:RDD family protein [Streptomyces sp. NBC_01500]MCX4550830.1 RDD family protein [Streptomyces sp. NBC_01500]
MSAPTSATGDGSPTPGYYPDPSIPGYVRYWNGASWVPGTSRPAPEDSGQAMPVPPGGTAPAPVSPSAPLPAVRRAPGVPAVPQVEETGPVFFDEEPGYDSRQEPSSAWQADASRQGGFGGERDRRVSWGGPDPRTPAEAPAPPGVQQPGPAEPVPDPRRAELPAGQQASRPALPTGRQEPPDGTVALRALRPGGDAGRTSRTDGTLSIRAISPKQQQPQQQHAQQQSPQQQLPSQQQAPQPVQPQAVQPQPVQRQAQPQPAFPAQQQQQFPPQQAQQPQQQPQQQAPPPWPQQVHELARPAAEPEQQGLPAWKPVVEDPFLQAARAQAAARPAGLGKRFAARLIDAVVLGAVVGVIAVPLLTKAADHINGKIDEAKLSGTTVTVWLIDGTTAGCLGAVIGAFLVLGLLYEAVPTARWGRTLGKKLCGVQVRGMESYEAPGFRPALIRWLLYGVLGVLVVGVVDVLWCLFDRPWRQCLHDKAAGTFVAAD